MHTTRNPTTPRPLAARTLIPVCPNSPFLYVRVYQSHRWARTSAASRGARGPDAE